MMRIFFNFIGSIIIESMVMRVMHKTEQIYPTSVGTGSYLMRVLIVCRCGNVIMTWFDGWNDAALGLARYHPNKGRNYVYKGCGPPQPIVVVFVP